MHRATTEAPSYGLYATKKREVLHGGRGSGSREILI